VANNTIITGVIKAESVEAARIDRAINLAFGGWVRFGECDPDADAFDRRHFLECYRIVAEKEERQENLLEQLRETRAKIEAMRPTNRFLPAGEEKER